MFGTPGIRGLCAPGVGRRTSRGLRDGRVQSRDLSRDQRREPSRGRSRGLSHGRSSHHGRGHPHRGAAPSDTGCRGNRRWERTDDARPHHPSAPALYPQPRTNGRRAPFSPAAECRNLWKTSTRRALWRTHIGQTSTVAQRPTSTTKIGRDTDGNWERDAEHRAPLRAGARHAGNRQKPRRTRGKPGDRAGRGRNTR